MTLTVPRYLYYVGIYILTFFLEASPLLQSRLDQQGLLSAFPRVIRCGEVGVIENRNIRASILPIGSAAISMILSNK